MIFTLFKAICRKNRQIFPFYSPKLPILPRCLWKTVLCYILFTSHCVPSLAAFSDSLRRSLCPIASHPWPLFHEKPTMSQYVPTLELQNGCLSSKLPKIMSQPCPNIHDRSLNVANYYFDLANSQAHLSTKQMKIVANSWPNRGPIVAQ